MTDTMSPPLSERLRALDWQAIDASMSDHGYAATGSILTAVECGTLVRGYADESLFRRRVVMENHGYGSGEYQYFTYPLPEVVQTLRAGLYPALSRIANGWNDKLGLDDRFPEDLAAYTARCHAAGQLRPTPLVLKYRPDDFNHLHQDLYGDEVFPIQATFLLSNPETDFTGGEFVLTAQRPRMQSRVEVVPLVQGEAVLFPVRYCPGQGKRGYHRVAMRHGVSRLRSGNRFTLGIIFHDAA